MPRVWVVLSVVVALLTLAPVRAQTISQATAGEPPLLSLIDISPADADGMVTISGVSGAVFPNARLAIRNLYTGQTTMVQAGVTGSFSARMFGPGNTPFWISPIVGETPSTLRDIPEAMPGGPATIIYGPFPEMRQATTPVTRIRLDGDLSDWEAYPQASFLGGSLFGLRNRQSLYLAATGIETTGARLQVVFTVDATTYQVTVDPESGVTGQLTRLTPDVREVGPVPVAVVSRNGNFELRLPFAPIGGRSETVTLNELRSINSEGVVLQTLALDRVLESTGEVDGVVRLNSAVGDAPTRFTLGGPADGGASYWTARGRTDRLAIGNRNDPVHLELDIRLVASEPPPAVNFRAVGQISLAPIVAEIDGQQHVAMSPLANNGWSTVRTPSGLAIHVPGEEILLGEAWAEAPDIVLHENTLTFGLTFEFTIPETLPAGLYAPVFRGYIDTGEARIPWGASGLFTASQPAGSGKPTRLPILYDIAAQQPVRLLWALFADHPSNGSRGLLSEADQAWATLANRVRFDSPTYILPPVDHATGEPIGYPLEPYLYDQMPNAFQTFSAPLIPFLLPGGRLSVSVTRPNGETDNLGTAPILQNRLSTVSVDERERFGEFSPVDVYRLTTLNTLFTAYTFEDYGPYRISMTGMLEDVWGNRYEGGGVYEVLVAELLSLTPSVLPGTSFEVGDTFNPGLHLSPGVPADVTITLRVYPLDGGDVIETRIEGQANRFGYFHAPDGGVRFTTPGEYTVDYEARYTDSAGRLWAASQRAAGVIARPDSSLVLHGRRGLANVEADMRPAWYNAAHYAAIVGAQGAPIYPNIPYHSGDVLWLEDAEDSGLMPALTVQDTAGQYEQWLAEVLPEPVLRERSVRHSLPLMTINAPEADFGPALAPGDVVNDAYAYVSLVRPGVTARQLVVGTEDDATLFYVDPNDRYNRQIGAGFTGDRPGDYLFMFGGAVVRNSQARIAETAIYGSLVMTVAEGGRGTRVYPPYRGQAGGADGGPLFTLDGQAVEIFFYPSGARPGAILEVGDRLSIAGNVAPLLPSRVRATITAPDGREYSVDGVANAVGYFYDPAQDLIVDEAGIWTVDIDVWHEGPTSAGIVEPPYPTGGIPGAPDGRFSVYVVPKDVGLLPVDRQDASFAPGSRYNFNFAAPSGWSDVRVHYTLKMPGYVVEQGELPMTGSTFTYPYDPSAVSERFPNFEPQSRASGSWVSDPLTLTLFVTGVDGSGNAGVQTREITLMHDRLLSLGD